MYYFAIKNKLNNNYRGMIMKTHKLLAVLLSLFMSLNTVGICYAEEENGQETTIENNDADDQSNTEDSSSYTYNEVISDYADDVPYYESDVETYTAIPSSFELDKQLYPDVRDQGTYGTCWAFAALGLSEFDLINKHLADKSIDLSELQLAHFVYNSTLDPLGGTAGDQSQYYNRSTSYSYLDRGGMYEYAVRRLSQWSGAVNESDVPYNTENINNVLNNGLDSSYAYSKDVAHLENAYVMSLKNNTDDVKRAIMQHGAVGVQYYHSDSKLLWNSANQLWTYYDSQITGGGHNVMIVGWDDNFSKDNFVGDQPANNGAWLIRNSWGFTQSYFWMSYENQSLLDAAWVFDMNRADNYDNNYQLDGGIDSDSVSNNICYYKTYSNVFTVQNKENITSEDLKAVSLSFTHVSDVNYKIEVYTDLKTSNPYSGTKQEQATTEGTTTYAGLYTIPLTQSIQLTPGSSFAVVVTTDKYALDYEQGINWEKNGVKVWDAPVSLNSGKSFYGTCDNQWDWYWGNFCIKAFTTNNYQVQKDISNAEITLNEDFSEDNPSITVSKDGKTLIRDVDYTMSYAFNSFKSKFKVTLTGINDYSGSVYKVLQVYSNVGESLNEYSLCLNGLIEMYFHFYLTDELKNDSDAYVLFTMPDGRQTKQYVKDTEYIEGLGYRFKCGLYASEMTQKVKFVFVNSKGEMSKEYSRSVEDYTNVVFSKDSEIYKKVTSLLKSMLNYGGYAQNLFQKYETDLAYKDVKNDFLNQMNTINLEDLQKYKLVKSGSDSNITFKEYALVLKEGTSINVYFTNVNQTALSTYKAYVDGNETKLKKDGRGYYIEVPSISSSKLDVTHTVKYGDLEFKVSALSWVRGVLNKGDAIEATTSNVAKAIYLYWKESKAYFG